MSKKVTKYLVRTFSECLCIFLFILLEISVVSGSPEWEADDTVVVEVPVKSRTIRSISNSTGSRKQRQFVGWPGLIQAGPCLTSQGRLGRCTSFRSCYPYFKLPDLSQWEAFSLGAYSHDTCSYFQGNGEHAFGICCTGSGSQRPAQPGADPVTNRPVTQSPNNPVPASWPPPIPTHPPDHTIPPLPTHPPYPGYPTHPTTQRPITVQSTFQTSQWPPPLPTHPPGHPGHWPATQQPTVWPPTQKPVTQPPWPPQQPVTQAPWPPTQKPVTQPPWPPQQPVTQPPWPPQQPVTQAPWPPTQKPVTQAPWPPTQQPPTHDNEITDNSCGAKNGYQDQERIVGGQNADVGEWPWIAALFNSGRQFCGGSLIDNEHILTAAHCVAHMTSWDVARMTVRLGDHNLRTNTDTRHIEKKVKRVVRHKGFDARTLYNDVAVLTLDSPVTFSKQIRPICLPSAGISDYAGTQSTVIGWGSLRESGAQSHILQEVSIPIWTNSRCKQKYGHAAPGGIIDSFLCAGEPNRDSCSGDSGGPLMVNHGRWTQVGIVSWGIGCGKGQYPGVYTRVTAFMPWITKNLK